ncbi:MAG: hypothetical protein K0S86_1444 [Geminicoccaceae bacterium]|jgi:Tol biopolymer transport system component|nr:hypothetical protein [Geminicoccaceae bacterium]
MQIDSYTARHVMRDAHQWPRLVAPVAVLALTVGLATACGEDRATNPTPPAVSAARVPGGHHPDGRIVFLADTVRPDGEFGGNAVHVMNPDGSGVARLTPYLSLSGPVWSPDRKRIAFGDHETGMIGVMNANGKNLRWLVKGDFPSWSPDGRRIVFSRVPEDGGTADLYVMNADGTGVVQLMDVQNIATTDPSWSPDGKWIAFTGSYSGGVEVFVMEASGGIPKLLTHCDDAGQRCSAPEWGPRSDSLSLAYVASAGTVSQLRVLNIASAETVSLADQVGSPLRRVTWSPDGTRLLFGARRDVPREALYSVDIVTTVVERRSFLGVGEHDASWR